MKNIRIFLISILFIIPICVYADSQASIVMDPENPAPYESLKLTVKSYSFNVDTTKMTWYVNGKLFTSGIGEKTISINTRGVGESTPVLVKIETSDGGVLELKLQVTPQNVDLIWESLEAYTPPFYEGKALPGEGSIIRATAIPSFSENGKQILPSNLSYSWYINDEYIDNASGYGKQYANLKLDYLTEKTNIKVRVQSVKGYISEKTLSILPHEIMPLFYSYDEILGNDFSQLLNRRIETVRDVNINLVPFYLSTKGTLNSATSYAWALNGLPITPQDNLSVILAPAENSRGSKILSVTISNSKRILQKATSKLEIIFDTRN